MDGQSNNKTDLPNLDLYFMRTSLWPAILYTVLLMVIGTVGNILVLIVYRRQFQRSVTRMFIYALAILDLGNCLVTMPAELDILIQFTTFPSPAWCKISRFLTYIFNGTSSVVLIAIAMDRYFKVCKLNNTLITVRRAKIICAASFAVTSFLAIPALVIYGEMQLPIFITNDSLSIMPLSDDYKISTKPPQSTMAQDYKHASSTSRWMRTKSSSKGSLTGELVYGKFCLLNSDYIDGTMPLLFYVSMFSMYLAMVVLVVFFYSKVARTMFVLKSKHSKMFTFYPHKTPTQSSNSVLNEGKSGGIPEASSAVVFKEINSDVQENINPSGTRKQGCPEKSATQEAKKIYSGETAKHRSNGMLKESFIEGNARETGYETDDLASNSEEAKFEHFIDQKQERVGLGRPNQTNSEKRNEKSRSCGIVGQKTKESQGSEGNLSDSKFCNKIHHQKSSSADDIDYVSPREQSVKKKHGTKIPKIKVCKASTDDEDLVDVNDHLQLGQQPDLAPCPFSTNSLLRRRIKSAENISHLSRLQKLQVPDRRFRGAVFPDLSDPGIDRTQLQHTSRREIATGKVTTSCVNLDVIENPANSQEKTLTLTKMSFNGKKRLCVLPLTGIATRAASRVQETQKIPSEQNDKPEGGNKNDGSPKSDSKLEQSRNHDEIKDTPACVHLDFNSTDLDSVVTLRNRTPEAANICLLPMTERKPENAQVQFTSTQRKEIVSTADILQEQHKRGSLHPYRTSRMLFAISLIFVISFLPFFVIALARSSMGSSFMTMSELELGITSVFIRSSLLSNAVNPIIYGLLSTHFRRECTGVMLCIFRR